MKKRFITLAMLGIMTASMVVGCGSKDEGGRERNSSSSYETEYDYNFGEAAPEYVNEEYVMYDEEPAYDALADNSAQGMTEMKSSSSSATSSKVLSDDGSGNTSNTVVKEDKMVYEANLTIETLDFDKTYGDLVKLIDDLGGRIDSEQYDAKYQSYTSDARFDDGYHTTKQDYLVIKIPADKYKDFMNADVTLGNVIGKNQNTSNISQQYYSTETRIELLEGQLEYYKHQLELIEEELMDVDDYDYVISQMIYLEDRIIDVQDEINTYKNNIVTMDSQVEYATVRLTLSEVKEYTEIVTPKQEKKNTFANRFKDNAKKALKGFTRVCEGVLYAIMYALPYLIITAVATLVIVLVSKKNSKKRTARALAMAPAAPAPLPEVLPSVAKKAEETNAKAEAEKKDEEKK